MLECVGWAMAAVLVWYGIYKLCRAIPDSQSQRAAEDDAFWKSQGGR